MTTHSFAPLVRMSLIAIAFVSHATGRVQAQPGPTAAHEIFKNDVGTWDATIKLFAAPGAEPTVSKCTETNELIGGMWLVSRFEGELMGMPFTGFGTWGYDPAEKKYVGTWLDNMSPYPQTIRGDYDPATKTMTSIAKSRDAMTGKEVVFKEFGRMIDANTRTFEMQMPDEKGDYRKILEIEYRRRAE